MIYIPFTLRDISYEYDDIDNGRECFQGNTNKVYIYIYIYIDKIINGESTFMTASKELFRFLSTFSLFSTLSLSWLLRRGGTGGDDIDELGSESSFFSRVDIGVALSSRLTWELFEDGLRGAGGGGR